MARVALRGLWVGVKRSACCGLHAFCPFPKAPTLGPIAACLTEVPPAFCDALKSANVDFTVDAAELERNARDGSQMRAVPLAVVKPTNTEQLAAAVTACRASGLRVTVAGGYTGLSAGALGNRAVRIATSQMSDFSIEGDLLRGQAGASIPAIIREASAKPASAAQKTDVYEYLGVPIGPVMLGGVLGANASGLVGCRVGAVLDSVCAMTVVLPSGEVRELTEGFDKHVGNEGKYGIITDAAVKLIPTPAGMVSHVLAGKTAEGFAAAAVAVLPMLAEGLVLRERPPDMVQVARNALKNPDDFIARFGDCLQPHNYVILLQATPSETETILKAVRAASIPGGIRVEALNAEDFASFKLVRAGASGAIGTGVSNPRPLAAGSPPAVVRAANFLADAIKEFRERGVKPKAEHSPGILWPFLVDEPQRAALAEDIKNGVAFDDGCLEDYANAGGDLQKFLLGKLDPIVTQGMRDTKTAVNFAGNEDILVKAEEFPGVINALDALAVKHGAIEVPLLYIHVSFRKMGGWILIHNRLLIDVMEFPH